VYNLGECQRSRGELGPVYVGCVAKKFALEQVLLQALVFSLQISVYQGSKLILIFKATLNRRKSGRSLGTFQHKQCSFGKLGELRKKSTFTPNIAPRFVHHN